MKETIIPYPKKPRWVSPKYTIAKCRTFASHEEVLKYTEENPNKNPYIFRVGWDNELHEIRTDDHDNPCCVCGDIRHSGHKKASKTTKKGPTK
jgi:hypothetical protein